GDELCLSCHNAPIGEISSPIGPEHSGHEPAAGVSCVDCHMPRTTYMQRHPRHDHSFSIPDPQLTIEHDLPNACNDCHGGESPEWALEQLREQHGAKIDAPRRLERRLERRNRARIVSRVRAEDPEVLPDLLKWAAEEPIASWRAVATGLLASWVGEPSVNSRLQALAKDEDPLVRASAVRAMDRPTPDLVPALRQAAEDEFRTVRVFAARSLHGPAVRGSGLPRDSQAARELETYLEFHADQPVGLLMRASRVAEAGQADEALEILERAAGWDPSNVELARAKVQVLASAGRDDEALEACLQNAERFRSSASAWFDLGLAQASSSSLGDAATAFERAVALESDYPRAWYNLGLARNALGEGDGALAALEESVRLVPQSAEYWYGLATVARDLQRNERALEAAMRLQLLVPNSPEAVNLVRELQTRLQAR
ncbi:MAG: ammonia-forming cytochrome c nitrite reductase subunit c552, partial [Planctomycetota bacterium]